jgi:glyoxylase-like metal-dependent hydrolase (beta-lactamase superfamily II)
VFRGTDGLVVVSPGAGMASGDLDALREYGEVRALVAINTLHHLGQRAWRERFGDAVSYCPPGAVKKLNEKVEGVSFRPLTELALPASVTWEDPPGYKTGETILSVATTRGSVWYTGDLLVNIPRLPPPPAKWLFTMTDSAPGFRLFRLAVWFMVKDKRKLKSWALARVDKHPPAVVVPAHGPAVEAPDLPGQTRKQLERL